MKSSNYIKIIVVVALIALAVGAYSVTRPSKKIISTHSDMPSQEKAVADIIQKGNANDCAQAAGVNIEGTNYETVCKNNIALRQAQATLDLSKCDNLDGNLMSPDLCKQDIIYKKIVKDPNSALCDSLGSQGLHDFCYGVYWTEGAIAKNDIAMCNEYKDQARVVRCKDEFFMDQLVFQGKQISCNAFSKIIQPGCAAYQKIKHVSPIDVNACLSTGNPAFGPVCIHRYQVYAIKHGT